MDASSLRTEIKQWERIFRKQHGRDATVQDIKDTPGMPEKYKLYKKLSKHGPSSNATSTSSLPRLFDRPSTPPNGRARTSAAASTSVISKPKPRAIKTEASLFTSNPFSPVKRKGKERAFGLEVDSLTISTLSRSHGNPFATPRKTKSESASTSQKQHVPRREPSPEPFPLIQQPDASTSAPHRPRSRISDASTDSDTDVHSFVLSHSNTQPGTSLASTSPAPHVHRESAVTRARKRLRGEPVSPSPVKEKRARVLPSVSPIALTFAHSTLAIRSDHDHECASGEDEFDTAEGPPLTTDGDEGEEEEDEDEEDTFFGESPVKQRGDGKQFKVLFDESTVGQRDVTVRAKAKLKPRPKSALANRFPAASRPGRAFSFRARSPEEDDDDDEMMNWEGAPQRTKIKALDISLSGSGNGSPDIRKQKQPQLTLKRKPTGLKNIFDRAGVPGKDDLWAPASADTGSGGRSKSQSKSAGAPLRIPNTRKRSLSADEMDVDDPNLRTGKEKMIPHPLLLPPSPPPATTKSSSSSRTGDKGKAKGKALSGAGRKKAKLLEEMVCGEDDEDEADDEGSTGDVKERVWSWNVVHNPAAAGDSEPEFDPTLYRPAPLPAPDSPDSASETVEVSLPDSLREVLSIGPLRSQVKTYEADEERVARELVYGRREGHYDPARGGEIWGVGEISDEERDWEEGQGGKGIGNGNGRKREAAAGDDTDEWEGEPVPWEVGEL